MTTHRLRIILWTCAAVAIGLAAMLIQQTAADPAAMAPVTGDPSLSSGRASASTQKRNTPVTPAAIAQVSRLDLRRPLFDPPPVAVEAKPVVRSTSRMSLRLVGTINEPGHSMAMLGGAGDGIQIKSVGESVDLSGSPAQVLSIETDRVRVRYLGKEHELVMEEKEAKR